MELQEQLNSYNRELRLAQVKINALQRETRSCQVTTNYIETLKQTKDNVIPPLYRSVGKAFIKTDPQVIEKSLEHDIESNTKVQRDLEGQKEFLDRRIASTMQNMKDIVGV